MVMHTYKEVKKVKYGTVNNKYRIVGTVLWDTNLKGRVVTKLYTNFQNKKNFQIFK